MAGIIVNSCSQRQEIYSHMNQISKHVNSLNQKIHSYDQISKIIVNLGSNKCRKTTTPNSNSSVYRIRY